jgi:predicted transcriptional regulator
MQGVFMYSPKISETHVHSLYKLKQIEKRPMTKLVNEAISEFLSRKLPAEELNQLNNQTTKPSNKEISYYEYICELLR